MINYLLSLVRDKRNGGAEPHDGERRKPTLKEANSRLQKAADAFNNTVTLSPDRVRELLERAKR